MATFTKKAGAPAGTIRFAVGGTTLILNDSGSTSITTTDPGIIDFLKAHPMVQLQGGSETYTPPTYYSPVNIVQGTPELNDVITFTDKGWEAKPPTGGGGSGHTILDEGTTRANRTGLNFVGAGVSVTDDSGNNRTVVNIPGADLSGYQATSAKNANNGYAGLDSNGTLLPSVRIGKMNIDAWAEGMPIDGSTDTTSIWNAIKTRYPSGGQIHLPTNATLRIPDALDLSASPWFIEGNGATLHQPTNSGKAILVMNRRLDGYRVGARDLKIVGAGAGGSGITINNHASAPAGQVGFVARDLNYYENVTVNNCDYGFVAGGNHSTFVGVSAKNNRYNFVTGHGTEGYSPALAGSGTHGNNTYYSCDFTGGLASGLVLGNGMIDASAFYSCHFGAARDCFVFRPKTSHENALGGGTVFINCGLEYWGRSIIHDEGFNTNNRRMSSRTTWINTGISDHDSNFLPSGDTASYMVRIGLIKEWQILGGPGDTFNSNFGDPLGFEFESCQGLLFEGADTLISRCRTAGVLPFRVGGQGGGWFGNAADIRMFEASKRFQYLVCKVEAGQSVQIEKGVGLKWGDGLEALNYEVRHWDSTTGMSVGIAGFNASAGQLVPVIVQGSPIGAAYIYALPGGYAMTPGEDIVPERSHPGFFAPRGAYNSREASIGTAVGPSYTAEGGDVFRTKIVVRTPFAV